jgi:hypothetical protein
LPDLYPIVGEATRRASDLDVNVGDEAWKVAASSGAHPLAAWGPPIPRSILGPDDIAALARGTE